MHNHEFIETENNEYKTSVADWKVEILGNIFFIKIYIIYLRIDRHNSPGKQIMQRGEFFCITRIICNHKVLEFEVSSGADFSDAANLKMSETSDSTACRFGNFMLSYR